ncbi:hypothetical protein H072_8440 [Dactylellina haptotyla CBS 200.50]|uniref:AB hydrolase-1 domain-containing protein n=1 Tax=Dactylellina haptotyla (strain CBS 200.50) TaxID=1284197 RepID=S8A465_DACHA|nr:hypothetical protein H072_8440 [Dactylellina haptotyla CBS 200.50]
MIATVLKIGSILAAAPVGVYACFLGLVVNRYFQAHAVYLHAAQMTWFKDLDFPEMFGFLHNQVTPFSLTTTDGETLYAWHILPTGLYYKHESELLSESAGFASDITKRRGFELLRDDPEVVLILHFHGAGGTVGSGYRTPNYRALSAGKPDKIHVLTFDYRGFGRSTGSPTERGLLPDGIAAVEWVTKVAGIPPERIVLFAQSMGTAVAAAIMEHYALESPATVFRGTVMVAPFVDVPTLVATYRIAGTIPILGPLAKFPALFSYLSTFIHDKWLTGDRIAQYVRANEANGRKYRLTFVHAKDDFDVPWTHTPQLFWRAASAAIPGGITFNELEVEKGSIRRDLGEGGTVVEWQTGNGIIREEIVKYGLHDVIMGNSVVTVAVMRILDSN